MNKPRRPTRNAAILEKHGWTCDKKAIVDLPQRRWKGHQITYYFGQELSNNDPFASGSDDDDAKDVNAPIDAAFGTLGPTWIWTRHPWKKRGNY